MEIASITTPEVRITSVNDLRFHDWEECRKTIGRLDTILTDFRKVGFSIITGLLTAGAFLAIKPESVPSSGSPAVFIVVMVLVTALFSVDTYYQVLVSGAAERALDLEAAMNPPIRVTKYLSINATRSGNAFVILALYIVLLITAEGMGLFCTATNTKQTISWGFSWLSIWDWVPLVGIVIFGTGFIAALVAYIKSVPKPHALIAVLALPALTIVLAIFLLKSGPAETAGVWKWIVSAGMFLAIYIQFYWLYSAWRSGLYRHKPGRDWHEGNEKNPVLIVLVDD
jgi:hypothetical protein